MTQIIGDIAFVTDIGPCTYPSLSTMKTLVLALATQLFLTNSYAQSAQPGGDRFVTQKRVTISHVVTDDLYTAGGEVLVKAPIRGDLIAAAGTVFVQDSIYQDLTLAGGTLEVSGWIGDDILAMGGNIRLRESVQGDVLVMGGDVRLDESALVEHDLVVMGGNVRVVGNIRGNVTVRGGQVVLDGECGRNLDVKGGEVVVNGVVRGTSTLAAESIELGPEAQLYGDVRYWVPEGYQAPDFSAVLVGSTARLDPTLDMSQEFSWWDSPLPWFSVALAYLLAVVLMIVLIHWLFPHAMELASTALRDNFMQCFGYGVLYLIGVPLLIGLLFISLVGIPPGLFVLFLYGFSLAFGHIITSVVAAYALRDYYHYDWGKGVLMLVSFVIFAVLRVLTLTPFVGFFLSVIAVGACFGALIVPHLRRPQPMIA